MCPPNVTLATLSAPLSVGGGSDVTTLGRENNNSTAVAVDLVGDPIPSYGTLITKLKSTPKKNTINASCGFLFGKLLRLRFFILFGSVRNQFKRFVGVIDIRVF